MYAGAYSPADAAALSGELEYGCGFEESASRKQYPDALLSSEFSSSVVSPTEKKCIKRWYMGTFLRALGVYAGVIALSYVFIILFMLFGYEFRYDENDVVILDWGYELMATLPSICMCLIMFVIEKFSHHQSADNYFSTRDIKLPSLFGMFLALMCTYVVSIFLQAFIMDGFDAIGYTPFTADYVEDNSPSYLFTTFLTSVILAPIAEELMFRGIILRRLCVVSQSFGIFVSALFFGMMHGNILQTVLGFLIGIVFAYADIKANSLIPSILGHMFINSMPTITVFLQQLVSEEAADMFWMMMLIFFGIAGAIGVVAMFAARKIHFPDSTPFHKKRTLPLVLTCVSFWIIFGCYLYSIIDAIEPAAEAASAIV